jgi:porphobilinogen synthase
VSYSFLKRMAGEAGLRKSNLIMPLIVDESGSSSRYLMTTSMDSIENKVQKVLDLGIKKIMLYGIPKARNAKASEAWNPKGVVQSAVRRIKKNFGHKVEVSTDVCVCQYNLSGQCGTMNNSATDIDNDTSLKSIKTIALSHAQAGSDILAPSSMMDGQVSCIRQCLKENGFRKISIMSFSAKYDSCLYSPFRSTAFDNYRQTNKINKSTYQLSCSNIRQSLHEIQMDLNEGAKIIMVKPGILSSDLIVAIKNRFNCPVAVQNVSGEYLMIKMASEKGLINEVEWALAYLVGMRRAGADMIMSYHIELISKYLE